VTLLTKNNTAAAATSDGTQLLRLPHWWYYTDALGIAIAGILSPSITVLQVTSLAEGITCKS
jgi:hypothetical protein